MKEGGPAGNAVAQGQAGIVRPISRLSLGQRAELTAELCGWTDGDWGRPMKPDAAAGKLAPLNREADAAHNVGRTVPLEDILHEP